MEIKTYKIWIDEIKNKQLLNLLIDKNKDLLSVYEYNLEEQNILNENKISALILYDKGKLLSANSKSNIPLILLTIDVLRNENLLDENLNIAVRNDSKKIIIHVDD